MHYRPTKYNQSDDCLLMEKFGNESAYLGVPSISSFRARPHGSTRLFVYLVGPIIRLFTGGRSVRGRIQKVKLLQSNSSSRGYLSLQNLTALSKTFR